MNYTISDIQKQKFYEFTGVLYEENVNASEFKIEMKSTGNNEMDRHCQKNHDACQRVYWLFSYRFNPEDGTLIYEFFHRMTNHHVGGWYSDGSDVPCGLCEEVFYE